MSGAHFVTGATGFIGGALVLELLRRTDDVIVCGVRGHDGRESEQERLQASLRNAAFLYGEEAILPAIRARCRAVHLDITLPVDGLQLPAGLGRVNTFWHAAASLKFEERHRKNIFRDNLEGTRNALAAAAKIGARRFLYLSTAYVAGQRTGHIEEGEAVPSTRASNCYEESKIAAEKAVLSAHDLETRVLRPSIVIGHSRRLTASSFTGIYGFIREIKRFQRRVEDRLGAILSHRALTLIADPHTPLNVIPVDYVADNAVAVGLATSDERIFHLTNDTPALVGVALNALFRELGFAPCRFADSMDRFTTLDETLHRELSFYNSYLVCPKTFSRAHTDAAAGCAKACAPMDEASFMKHVFWYLRHLDGQSEDRFTGAAVAAGPGS